MHQTDTLIDWIKKTKISSADYILTSLAIALILCSE